MGSLLFDNPIARSEILGFLRKSYIWIPALLVVWIPMTWVTRSLVHDLAGPNMPSLTQHIILTLAMVLRPDVLIALLLVQRSASRDAWHNSREELAVSFISPGRIILGKALVPIALLSLLHAFGIWYYYSELLTSVEYRATLTDGGPLYHFGAPILILALVEDILFATVVVLIALRSYLLDADAFHATLGAIWRLFLYGLAVGLCGSAWELMFLVDYYYDVIPTRWLLWLLMDFGRSLLMGNMVWFGLVLPMHAVLIVVLWWRLRRHLWEWLRRE